MTDSDEKIGVVPVKEAIRLPGRPGNRFHRMSNEIAACPRREAAHSRLPSSGIGGHPGWIRAILAKCSDSGGTPQQQDGHSGIAGDLWPLPPRVSGNVRAPLASLRPLN